MARASKPKGRSWKTVSTAWRRPLEKGMAATDPRPKAWARVRHGSKSGSLTGSFATWDSPVRSTVPDGPRPIASEPDQDQMPS